MSHGYGGCCGPDEAAGAMMAVLEGARDTLVGWANALSGEERAPFEWLVVGLFVLHVAAVTAFVISHCVRS